MSRSHSIGHSIERHRYRFVAINALAHAHTHTHPHAAISIGNNIRFDALVRQLYERRTGIYMQCQWTCFLHQQKVKKKINSDGTRSRNRLVISRVSVWARKRWPHFHWLAHGYLVQSEPHRHEDDLMRAYPVVYMQRLHQMLDFYFVFYGFFEWSRASCTTQIHVRMDDEIELKALL